MIAHTFRYSRKKLGVWSFTIGVKNHWSVTGRGKTHKEAVQKAMALVTNLDKNTGVA